MMFTTDYTKHLLDNVKKIHFIGCGGSGMYPLIQILNAKGYEISGSDVLDGSIIRYEREMGVKVTLGHNADNVIGADLVVYSAAIAKDNVELNAAASYGIPTVERSVLLGYVSRLYKNSICVSGTHGKTTTSSMCATMLDRMGLDPSFLIGGIVEGYDTNGKNGSGDYFVAEADESDSSFLFLNPNVVIVTNVEADHLDHYSGIEEIEATFAKFMGLVGEDGTVIVCGEDPHLVELAKSTGRHVLSYGFAENNDIVCVHPDVKGIQSDFIVRFEDGTEHAVEIKSNPGRHNMLNATAVLTVAHVLGLDIDAAAKALSSFEGVRRRFTHVGDIDGITVVDDYGHHPTEIKATLAAASSLGYKHVDVVFQPHRYSRLQALCDDFADAFANADKLLLIDVFSAGEMPIPGVTSKMLADTVRAKHPGKEVVYCSSRLELNQELEKLVGEGDLLLTMGAGDVTTVGPEFIEYLTAKKDA